MEDLRGTITAINPLVRYQSRKIVIDKLDFDVVIVDEASMLDWHVAYGLFRPTEEKGTVILSGIRISSSG